MLEVKSPNSFNLKVERRTPELVTPAKPTPYEFKPLSDLENLDSFRMHLTGIAFYPYNPSMNGIDPVEVIRKAIAEILVFYYPFAGRLREQDPSGKLVIECNGEGILFVEADADVTLQQFGDPLVPPFPCSELVFDVPGSRKILNSPLILIQVTRLKCGGFIFGMCYNHAIADAAGIVQFMFAIGEMARGATSPYVLPVWERHILNFKNLQKLASAIPQSNESSNDLKIPPEQDLSHRTFFVGPAEITTLRTRVPPHLRHCSSFEILTASVWKCRVVAFQPHPTEETSLLWSVDLRSKLKHLIPKGYYGNAIIIQMTKSTAKEIIENPLSYTLELVNNAKKKEINIEEFAQTLANMKINMLSYSVSDWRHLGFEKLDFGWGEALYGAADFFGPITGCHLPYKNKNGENGIMLPLCLPKQVMERFEKELNNMLKDHSFSRNEATKSKL